MSLLQFWKWVLPDRVLLVGSYFFFFSYLNTLSHSLKDCKVSVEISAGYLMRVPLHVTSCFPLDAFKILSLALIFAILIIMCLGIDLFGFILFGLPLILRYMFPFSGWGSFQILFLQISSLPPSLLSSYGTPILWMLIC